MLLASVGILKERCVFELQMCSYGELEQEQMKDLLETEICENNGQRCTLLIIAARNGHDKMVKVFLNEFSVDLECEGSVRKNNYLIEGATVLCAAGNGHLNVVKTLVRAGADINHATVLLSTPLRAAHFNGCSDIAKYLIDHEADVSKTNKFNNSCLMIAAHRGT